MLPLIDTRMSKNHTLVSLISHVNWSAGWKLYDRYMCVSCLLGDFNVYGSPLSNNIRLSHRITLNDVIIQMQ